MIVRVFKTNRFYIFAFVLLLLVFLRFPGAISHGPIEISGYLPGILRAFEFLANWPILSYFLGIVLVLYQGILLSEIAEENRLFSNASNFPAFILALLYACVVQFDFTSPAMVASTFLVLALKRTTHIFNQSVVNGDLFLTGIYIGLSSLFFLPSIAMSLVLFYNLSKFRSFFWKEYVVFILGVLSIYFYVWGYYALIDESAFLWEILRQAEIFYAATSMDGIQWSVVLMALALLLMSYIYVLVSTQKRTIRCNNLYKVLALYNLLPLGLVLMFNADPYSVFILTLPSASLVISNFLLDLSKKWIGELLVYLFLTLVIVREVLTLLA